MFLFVCLKIHNLKQKIIFAPQFLYKMSRTKSLIALDFDHTIVNENSDIVARDLVDSSLIPEEVKILYKTAGWIPYMQEIFNILHCNQITKSEIINSITKISEVFGMIQLIKTLKEKNCDIIIISDSNLEFITNWNSANGITTFINKIYTNPAEFKDGLLEIKPFHNQTECKLSSENLCKGKILEDYIAEKSLVDKIDYKHVFYLGDGSNDLCAMLRLRKIDFACPRKEYICDKKLENIVKTIPTQLNASILRWENGHDLLENIIKIIEQ